MSGGVSTPSVQPAELKFVEELLQRVTGITLSQAVGSDLELCFLNAARTHGTSASVFLRRLRLGEAPAISCLIDHCVIGETYFFRHPEHFDFLRVFMAEHRDTPRLSLWSAGCSSGEEAYSLAMLSADLGFRPEQVSISATDLSQASLARAREGRFSPWSFRKIPVDLPRYFEANSTRLKKELRDRVSFAPHNLVTDSVPQAAHHVIFCRNVLIYFTAETAMAVTQKLASALVPGGYLVLGLPELPLARGTGLEAHRIKGATVLKRPLREVAAPPPQALPEKSVPPVPVEVQRAVPVKPLARRRRPVRTPAVVSEPKAQQSDRFREAVRLAQAGDLDRAEALAHAVAMQEQSPVAFLLQSMCLSERGQVEGAIEALEKALYLSPSMVMAHVELVSLFRKAGKPKDAERARRNALRALEKLSNEAPVEAVEPITAGALKKALEQLDHP
jgi:chemotaxis protein methyltransferase CheR